MSTPVWIIQTYHEQGRSTEEIKALADSESLTSEPIEERREPWAIPNAKVESIVEIASPAEGAPSSEPMVAHGTAHRHGEVAISTAARLRRGDFLADRILHRLAGWVDVIEASIEQMERNASKGSAKDREMLDKQLSGTRVLAQRIQQTISRIQDSGIDCSTDSALLTSCTGILSPLAGYLHQVRSPLYSRVLEQLSELERMLSNKDLDRALPDDENKVKSKVADETAA